LDDSISDTGTVVGFAKTALNRGCIVRPTGSALLKAGLQGEERLIEFGSISGEATGSFESTLYIVEGPVVGNPVGNVSSGSLFTARLFGLFGPLTGTSPALGSDIWIRTDAAVSLSVSSPDRKIGTVVDTAGSTFYINFDGSSDEKLSGLVAHDLAGDKHLADTLANLNTKISDATLIDTTDSRLSDARTPTAHGLGAAEHNADTLANLNAKVSDATLIDTGDARLSDARTPTAHGLGGAEHNSATLAQLNTKVSDATLIQIGDVTLDASYNGGTNISVDNGTITLSNSGSATQETLRFTETAVARTTPTISIIRDPAVVDAGAYCLYMSASVGGDIVQIHQGPSTRDAINIITSTSASGIHINHDGSNGACIDLNHGSPSEAIDINIDGASTTGRAILITETAVARTTSLIQLTRSSTATGHSIQIDHNGPSGAALDINHTSNGDAINIFLSNNTLNQALVVTESSRARTSTLVFIQGNSTSSGAIMELEKANGSGICLYIDNNETTSSGQGLRIDMASSSTAAEAIEINMAGLASAMDINMTNASSSQIGIRFTRVGTGVGVHIDQNGSGDILQLLGAGGSLTQWNNDASCRYDINLTPNAAFTVNCPDAGASSADSIITLAMNTTEATLYEWIECISAGSDIESRHEAAGDWHTDTGFYTSGAGDYAENLDTELAKSNYEEGDVMVISSEGKVDKSSSPNSTAIIGVYSTNPFVLGNNPISPLDMSTGSLELNSWEWALGVGPDKRTWNHIEITGSRLDDYSIGTCGRQDTPYSNACLTVLTASYSSGSDKTSVWFDQNWPNRPTQVDFHHSVPERDFVPVGMLGLVPTKCITENGTINPGDLLVTSNTAGYAMKASGSIQYGSIIGRAYEILTDTGSQNDMELIDCMISI
jgi:hypothetical protein